MKKISTSISFWSLEIIVEISSDFKTYDRYVSASLV